MISIIIPFYQRSPGLLLRAVKSVMSQTGTTAWNVVVIDDGSPINAKDELAPLCPALEGRLTFIRQPNRGVAAARNRGLDYFGTGTDIVAFLDSDDWWDDGHLLRVTEAFAAGADFYFENYLRFDSSAAQFTGSILESRSFATIDAESEIYWFGGKLFDLLFQRSPVATPTVAYNFSHMPHLRFRTDLCFCEDILFWMEADRLARKVAFSRTVGVRIGQGVNISRQTWGTLDEARRTLSQAKYHTLVQSQFHLTEAQRQLNSRALCGLDRDFWRSIAAAAMRGEYHFFGLAFSYLMSRPMAAIQMPGALATALQRKFWEESKRTGR